MQWGTVWSEGEGKEPGMRGSSWKTAQDFPYEIRDTGFPRPHMRSCRDDASAGSLELLSPLGLESALEDPRPRLQGGGWVRLDCHVTSTWQRGDAPHHPRKSWTLGVSSTQRQRRTLPKTLPHLPVQTLLSSVLENVLLSEASAEFPLTGCADHLGLPPSTFLLRFSPPPFPLEYRKWNFIHSFKNMY